MNNILLIISAFGLGITGTGGCEKKCLSQMAHAYFLHIDKNQKGFITQSEWVEYFLSLGTPSYGKFRKENYKQEAKIFRCLDVNKDGKLIERELVYQLSGKRSRC